MPSAALTPKELVSKINRLHSEIVGFANTSLERAIEIGELLTDTKASLEYGKWTLWAETNLKFSLRTAHNYIKLFENCQVGSDAKFAELSVVYKALASENGESKPSTSDSKPAPKSILKLTAEERAQSDIAEADEEAAKEIGFVPVDETGLVIPREVLGLWERRQEVQDMLTLVSKIKGALKKFQDTNDPLFRPCTIDTTRGGGQAWSVVIANLSSLYQSIKQSMPYAVCPTCQGKMADRCTTCYHRGWVDQHFWENATAPETRKMRAKIVASQK